MYKTLSILFEFFSLYGIFPDRKRLRAAFLAHPYFPSLLAIRDTIESLEYKCLPVHVPKKSFKELPLPCLAVQNKNSEEHLVILKEVKNGYCRVYDQQERWHTQSEAAFLEKWTGVALLLDKEKKTENFLAAILRKKRTVGMVLLGLAVFLLFVFVKNFSLLHGILLSLNLVGGLISSVFTLYHFTNDDQLINSICWGANKSGNSCTKILNSKSAYIYKGISWAELGLLYFLNLTLLFPFTAHEDELSALLKIYLIPGALFSLYSIAYQLVKKQRCNLCLLTLFIIWSQIILLAIFDPLAVSPFKITTPNVFLILLLSISSLFWFAATPTFKEWLRLEDQFFYNLRFRLHPDVIAGFLAQQEKAPPMEHLSVLETSNSARKHIVSIVTNPTCRPCQETHYLLKKLSATGTELKVRYIFLLNEKIIQASNEDIKHHIEKLIPDLERYFFTPVNRAPVLGSSAAGSDGAMIYRPQDDYLICHGDNDINLKQIAQEHRAWCMKHHINGTPTIFIDERVMPVNFLLQDLKYYFKYKTL